MKISFDFLPAGRKYMAAIYSDGDKAATKTKVGIRKIAVTSKTALNVKLKASGGQAIWLKPL